MSAMTTGAEDIFSRSTRRAVSWAETSKLQSLLCKGSLIDSLAPSKAAVENRIEQLVSFEESSGVVFFAEKLWLQTDSSSSYQSWVSSRLLRHSPHQRLEKTKRGWKGRLPSDVLPSIADATVARHFQLRTGDVEYWLHPPNSIDENDWEARMLARAFHVLFNINHFAAMTFSVECASLEANILDSVKFWVHDIHILDGTPYSKFWLFGLGDPYNLGHTVFATEDRIANLLLWPNFDYECVDKFAKENPKQTAKYESAFWI